MPTGYTADVADGKITEFKDFALQCARAFGAYVHMRDDPGDAPLRPDEPSSYYTEALPKAVEEVKRLRSLTDEEWRDEWLADLQRRSTEYRDAIARVSETRTRYEAMLAAVQSWTPPSPDHSELKQFMVEQLTKSIDFDCNVRPPSTFIDLPIWKNQRLASAAKDAAYLQTEADKDRERVAKRNLWASQLHASLEGNANATR